ncbi:Uncharacterized protein K02A2.6 [Stylophora pistillata]|uniref:Uncharacterized protein K02A2.6 n=1 Tax=Stylophora pistillata TaxID=50429 RepID=A0A2B4SHH2_STYPI|nr:Uncharacterized protein K02A2.6 [Stylophora pistillata]
MGRDWLHKVRLDWYAIKSLKASQTLSTTKEQLQTMLDKYSDVFEDKLGTFKSAKAKLTLKEDSQAHFCKARAVPYALRPKVEEELRRLQNEGILTKVEWSEWATPIVPVPKKDGSVRLCGIPPTRDGRRFQKIPHHQHTHMGLFQYNRLVFGITSAPAIWQRTIDQVLEGTSGTSCIPDDMIITGNSDEEHLANLQEVLRRLQFHGLRANKAKCIGTVLSRVINDGTERLIAFGSRTLTKTEQKYAQIDKEALSIIWGVKKFHMYLFGRPFTLYTDHRPLTSIFPPRKSIPVVTVARLQHYALFLAGYDYSIQYKNTKVHSNADGLSRLPLVTEAKEKEEKLFARYGVPAQLESDNGPQSTSEEFQQLLRRNGIKHITSAPYHPATNGLAERAVQSFKSAMKSETEVTSLNIQLARFLLTYRNTPYSTTGEPPSQLFLGRRLRTRLDLLKPDPFIQINNRQIDQSVAKSGSVTRHFCIGQRVTVRNHTGKSKGRLPAHNNVSKEERKALNNLKKDQSRVVMKAEKGNRFVVMDRSDYDSKMETLLNDRSTYEVVPTSPFPRIERELNALLISLKRQLKIDETTFRKIH